MKRVLICYFSCTGNTKLACEYIKHNLSNTTVDLFDVRQEPRPEFSKYDLVGFATYTDWCDVPLLMQNFLGGLPKMKDKAAFLFNTCAGLSGKTLKTMYKLVEAKGFRVAAGFTLDAPESCPLLRVMGKTKEELPSTNNLTEFKKFVQQLNQIISLPVSELPRFRLKLGLMNTITPGFPRKTPKLFMGRKHIDFDACTKCGLCEKVCPYQAIKDGPVFVPGKCAGCWACFNTCPQNAIYTKRIKDRGHYKGPVELYRNKLKTSSDKA